MDNDILKGKLARSAGYMFMVKNGNQRKLNI
jgi:hypothetical protein